MAEIILKTFMVTLFLWTVVADKKRLLVDDNDYLDSRLRLLEATVAEMNKTIGKLQLEAKNTREAVGFYATLSTPHAVGQEQTIIFDKVVTNVGHGYSEVSGVFTAPKTGYYHFSSTIVSSTHDIHTQMMLNNTEIGRNYGNEDLASGTINVFVSVNQGGQVYIRHSAGVPSQNVYAGGYSAFSGFFIE